MEEGYDWDQIGGFRIVDGMNISSSPLLDDELIITPSDLPTSVGIPLDQREFQRQICSPLSQFLVGSDTSPSLKIDDQKHFSHHNHTACAPPGTGSGFGLPGSHSPALGESSHNYGIHAGLPGSGGAGIRDGSLLYGTSGFKFCDATDKVVSADKELTKRKRGYNSSTPSRVGGCVQNGLSGLGRPVMDVGGIGAAGAAGGCSLGKPPGKPRARKVRESQEEFGSSSSGSSVHSKSMYASSSGEGGCSFSSAPNISEDLNSVKYYEGFKLPLGDLGRKMLLKKLREIHTQNPTKMEKALTDHGLSYTRIRFASVQQLFKISYVCDVFDYALSIHCEFGRPRHRDSSKGVQLSSTNSAGSGISSKRGAVSDQFESHSGVSAGGDIAGAGACGDVAGGGDGGAGACIDGGGAGAGDGHLEDSSNGLVVTGKLENDADTYTPDTSPCSHRSYSSTKSLYSKESSGLVSNTPMSKVEHDVTSPISMFSTTSGSSPASQRKRRGSAKSSYNFSPPPIPVTSSPLQSIDPKDVSSLGPELSNYMSGQNMMSYGVLHGGGMGSSVSGFGVQGGDMCTSHFSEQPLCHYGSLEGRAQSSYRRKHDEHESLDSVIPANGSPDSSLHKPPTKRQKVRSKRKSALADLRGDPPMLPHPPPHSYASPAPSAGASTSCGSGIFGCGDIEEIYCTSAIGADVTPFYQPESEIAHLGDFYHPVHHYHHNHPHLHPDSAHLIYSSELHDRNIPTCSIFGSPFDSSLVINSSLDATESCSQDSEAIVYGDNAAPLYLYSQPNLFSSFDDYVDSSCLSGFLTQGLNSMEVFGSGELEMDNFDIGSCPLISI